MTATRPLPPHGTYARYKGTKTRPPCRCKACVANWTRRGAIRELARLNGTPPTVPPGPIVEHIRLCIASGMSRCLIARKANVAQSTISRLARGVAKSCYRDQAERILAVRPAQFDNLALRPACGTIRRVRALYAIAHGPAEISSYSHVDDTSITKIAGGLWDTVTPATEHAVITAYRALASQPGNNARALKRAQDNNWAQPMAWDDDTIDDPNAQPAQLDEPHLNRNQQAALLREEIEHLASFGVSHHEIATRLNVHGGAQYVRDRLNHWKNQELAA